MTNNLIHWFFDMLVCWCFRCVACVNIAYVLCERVRLYRWHDKKHNDNRWSLHCIILPYCVHCSCSSCFRLNAFHMCVICHSAYNFFSSFSLREEILCLNLSLSVSILPFALTLFDECVHFWKSFCENNINHLCSSRMPKYVCNSLSSVKNVRSIMGSHTNTHM